MKKKDTSRNTRNISDISSTPTDLNMDMNPTDTGREDSTGRTPEGRGLFRKRKTGNGRRQVRIKEVNLHQEEEIFPDDFPNRKGKRRNTELGIVTYTFVFLFLILTGYLVWFNLFEAEKINANVYNTKQDANDERIIRGSIISADGQILAGTNVDEEGNETRVYPYANVFSHIVGYGTNGKAGIESSANNDLMTSHASILSQIRNEKESDKIRGDSVVLTLDTKLQQAAYNALGSSNGAVVVMEPDTGKLLAVVSKPDFDPNTIAEDWDYLVSDETNSSLLNRAFQGLYPPGSTFKILTTLAYLREFGANYINETYECTGSITKEDVTINCYDWTVHGQEDMQSAFAHSCNTYFAHLGMELDLGKFHDLCEDFQFNGDMPVDLPSSTSVFKLDDGASYGEQMTTAIGQGDTLVTPLLMAMVTSSVANGGVMMKPYYIDHIETFDQDMVKEYKPSIYREVMSTSEAAVLTAFMQETVNSGTATSLSWGSYTCAGKTGSAEYTSGDYDGTHSWFVGFSNVADPDIVVAVIAEDGGTGSTTAVPIAKAIFDAYYS